MEYFEVFPYVTLFAVILIPVAHLILKVRVTRFSLVQDVFMILAAWAAVSGVMLITSFSADTFGGEAWQALAVVGGMAVSALVPMSLMQVVMKLMRRSNRGGKVSGTKGI